MNVEAIDRLMMGHCIGLSKASGKAGEYPYAAVVCRDGMIVAESINRVTHDGDVTRHAEVVAISRAQKTLRTVSLEDRDPRDPHPPRGLWVEFSAHGRRVEVEHSGRRGHLQCNAGSVRTSPGGHIRVHGERGRAGADRVEPTDRRDH
jgi:hypothetical protein